MSCLHCTNKSLYKCPTCLQPYCSVGCYKIHKQNPCSAPKQTQVLETEQTVCNVQYEYPTEDTVPLEKLKLLEQSEALKKCLENPHVRKLLETLDKSPNPDGIIGEYMQEPIFTEFVDICLNIVQEGNDNEQ